MQLEYQNLQFDVVVLSCGPIAPLVLGGSSNCHVSYWVQVLANWLEVWETETTYESGGSIWTAKAVTRLSYHGHPLSLKIKQLYVVFLAKVVPLCLNLFFIKHWTLACYMLVDFCIDILNQNKVSILEFVLILSPSIHQFSFLYSEIAGSIWTVKAVVRLSYQGRLLSLKDKTVFTWLTNNSTLKQLPNNFFGIRKAQIVMFHIGYKYLQIGWKFVSINHHVFRGETETTHESGGLWPVKTGVNILFFQRSIWTVKAVVRLSYQGHPLSLKDKTVFTWLTNNSTLKQLYVVFLAKVVPLHLNLFFIKHWTLASRMLVDFCIDILNHNKVEAQTVMFHIGYKYLQVGWKFVSINHHVFRGLSGRLRQHVNVVCCGLSKLISRCMEQFPILDYNG
ncbi:unnamed protein product [Vicia faba]|uniref:Uncharacterized protein n=1 Tax=Vicia faba TaxID=3906 RepID=A0AAV0Z7C6_VICFA|nr:unnamed protein product [Vicia faba]